MQTKILSSNVFDSKNILMIRNVVIKHGNTSTAKTFQFRYENTDPLFILTFNWEYSWKQSTISKISKIHFPLYMSIIICKSLDHIIILWTRIELPFTITVYKLWLLFDEPNNSLSTTAQRPTSNLYASFQYNMLNHPTHLYDPNSLFN